MMINIHWDFIYEKHQRHFPEIVLRDGMFIANSERPEWLIIAIVVSIIIDWLRGYCFYNEATTAVDRAAQKHLWNESITKTVYYADIFTTQITLITSSCANYTKLSYYFLAPQLYSQYVLSREPQFGLIEMVQWYRFSCTFRRNILISHRKYPLTHRIIKL